MVESLFGGRTAASVMLYLAWHEEGHGARMSRVLRLTHAQVQRQLERFERAGFLEKRLVGRRKLFRFRDDEAPARKLRDLLRTCYRAMPPAERERLFLEG